MKNDSLSFAIASVVIIAGVICAFIEPASPAPAAPAAKTVAVVASVSLATSE